MSTGLSIAACLLACASAVACYGGSGHCRLPRLRALHRHGGRAGLGLAGLALALAVVGLGAGAGLCLVLGSWMLAAMLLPWLGAIGDIASPPRGGG